MRFRFIIKVRKLKVLDITGIKSAASTELSAQMDRLCVVTTVPQYHTPNNTHGGVVTIHGNDTNGRKRHSVMNEPN